MKKVVGYLTTRRMIIKITGYVYIDSIGGSWIIFRRKDNPKLLTMSNNWGCVEATTGFGFGIEFYSKKKIIDFIEMNNKLMMNYLRTDSDLVKFAKTKIMEATKAE